MRKILDFVAVAYWDPYYVGRPGTGIATAICNCPSDGGGWQTFSLLANVPSAFPIRRPTGDAKC